MFQSISAGCRRLSDLMLAVGICALLLWAATGQTRRAADPQPTIDRLQRLENLTVLSVPAEQVQESRIDGRTGGVSALLEIHGEVLMGVDLKRARLTLRQKEHVAEIVLPSPQLLCARIDHQHSQLYSVDKHGLWLLSPFQQPYTAAVNKGYADAEASLALIGQRKDVIAQAKEHAEEVLQRWCEMMGWKVRVIWDEKRQPSQKPET